MAAPTEPRVIAVFPVRGPCEVCGHDATCAAHLADGSRLVHHRVIAVHPCHLPAPEVPKGQSK